MKTDDRLTVIENDLKEMKHEYELFFTGETRIPPEKLRKKVQKEFNTLTNEHITNTHLRFRMQSLLARFNSYQRLWDRIMFQIDQGTYKPNQFKADLRVGTFDKESGVVKESTNRLPRRFQKEDNEVQEEKKLKNLYNTYIETRRVTKEKVEVPFELFKKSIENSRAILDKKFNSGYDFKVVIEDGKAKIKGVKKGS